MIQTTGCPKSYQPFMNSGFVCNLKIHTSSKVSAESTSKKSSSTKFVAPNVIFVTPVSMTRFGMSASQSKNIKRVWLEMKILANMT